MPGSGDAQASQKCAEERPDEDNNPQKTSRDGAAQDQVKSNHNRGGQEYRTGGTTPLYTGRDQDRGRDRQGEGGSINGGGRTQPSKENPQGLERALTMLREAKGG